MTKAIVSSGYLLKKLSALSCANLDYVSVFFSKDKLTIHGVEIEGHCNTESTHQVRIESINTLVRILKTFSDTPIVIGGNGDSRLYLMEVML